MTQELKLSTGNSGRLILNITTISLLLPAEPFPGSLAPSLAPLDAVKGSQASGEVGLCCG